MNPPMIDEILRRDAESWQPPSPPPLDDALDRAIGHRRRVATRTWLAAAAVVLAVVAASVLIALRHGSGPSQPAAGPSTTPSSTSVGVPPGYALERNFATTTLIEGAVLPGDDPRTVDIVVTGLNPGTGQTWPPDTCGFYRPVATVVAQGARAVRVRVSGDVLVPRPLSSGSCGGSGPWLVLPVQLDRRLGSRTLRIGSSVIDVLPAQPPVPSYLPAGFVADGVQHPDPANLRFVSSADYRNPAGDHLVVRIGPYNQVAPTGPRRNPVTIHFGPGSFSGGGGNQPLCLTFVTRSMAFNTVEEQVCMVGRPDSGALQQELVRVARSLPQR